MHTKENPLELYGLDRTIIPFNRLKNHSDSGSVPQDLKEEFIDFCNDKRQDCSYSIGVFDKMEIWRTSYELYYALYEFAHNYCQNQDCSKYFAFFKYQQLNASSEANVEALSKKILNLERKVNGQHVDAYLIEEENILYLNLWNKKIAVKACDSKFGLPYSYVEFHLNN